MNDRICDIHNYPYQFVCRTNHACEQNKLLCSRCLSSHQQLKFQQIDDFKEEVLKYLENAGDLNKVYQFRQEIKQSIPLISEEITLKLTKLLEKMQIQLNKVQQIDEEVSTLYETIRNQQFLDLPNKIIFQLLDSQGFEKQFDQKLKDRDGALSNSQLIAKKFLKDAEKFLEDLDKYLSDQLMVEEFVYEGKQIKLIGGQIAGVKDGDYKYAFDDHEEYAGRYNFDKKIGLWKEYKIKDDKMIIVFVEYENGILKKEYPLDVDFMNVDEKWIQINQKNEQDEKIGFWREQMNKLWYEGNYNNGFKVGNFKISYQNEQIGGGTYGDFEQKENFWREVYEKFDNDNQVIFEGMYSNNKKVGYWKILYRKDKDEEFYEIGRRNYNDDGIQEGYQEDIDENFRIDRQLIYKGTLRGNKKVDKWTIYFRGCNQTQFQYLGEQNIDEYGQKQGLQRIPCENFSEQLQLLTEETYFNNMPIENQKILFRQYSQDEFIELAGGGYSVFGTKNGQWREICDNFRLDRQVIYEGNYSSDQRIGLWKILYRQSHIEEFIEIGGGTYTGLGQKQGLWREIDESFNNENQIIWEGNYSNGFKNNNWRKDDLQAKSKSKLFVF